MKNLLLLVFISGFIVYSKYLKSEMPLTDGVEEGKVNYFTILNGLNPLFVMSLILLYSWGRNGLIWLWVYIIAIELPLHYMLTKNKKNSRFDIITISLGARMKKVFRGIQLTVLLLTVVMYINLLISILLGPINDIEKAKILPFIFLYLLIRVFLEKRKMWILPLLEIGVLYYLFQGNIGIDLGSEIIAFKESLLSQKEIFPFIFVTIFWEELYSRKTKGSSIRTRRKVGEIDLFVIGVFSFLIFTYYDSFVIDYKALRVFEVIAGYIVIVTPPLMLNLVNEILLKERKRNKLLITAILIITLPLIIDKFIVLKYLIWLNLVGITILLWACGKSRAEEGKSYLMLILPSVFLTFVFLAYILSLNEGFAISRKVYIGISLIISVTITVAFIKNARKIGVSSVRAKRSRG